MKLKNVFLDRLTVVGFKIDSKLQLLISDPNFTLIGERYRCNYPYEWQYDLFGGGVLQIGNETMKSNIRIDFNPSGINDLLHKKMLKKLIGCIKYARTTRHDPAIDIENINMNNYSIIDDLSRKRNNWVTGTGKLETTYVGAPNADLRLRIYDKAKERGVDGKLWRFEAQMRREFSEGYKTVNPFDGVQIVNKEVDLSHIKSLKERVFIDYLLKNTSDLSKLAHNTRYRYKKILSNLGRKDSKTINLYEIYEENKHKIIDKIEFYLEESYINNHFVFN